MIMSKAQEKWVVAEEVKEYKESQLSLTAIACTMET